jgi:hypothetical protein
MNQTISFSNKAPVLWSLFIRRVKNISSGNIHIQTIFVGSLNIFTNFSLLFILAMRELAAEGCSSVGAF